MILLYCFFRGAGSDGIQGNILNVILVTEPKSGVEANQYERSISLLARQTAGFDTRSDN